MKNRYLCLMLMVVAMAHANAATGDDASPDEYLLDDLPDAVRASMEVRDRWFLYAESGDGGGPQYVVSDLLRWLPGQTVRVAFLGGDSTLHRQLEEATKVIAEHANLKLDFGRDPATGSYRTWSTSDTDYNADIRVSFDQRGYFSLVGTDAIAGNIGGSDQPVGGRPYQRTLNLQAFDVQKPASWRGIAVHEFMHAIGFQHEHQNFRGPCQEEFRWYDDPGYVPTQTAQGVYVKDANGRRPGLYTFLAGAPNRWDKRRVDFNLGKLPTDNISASGFDRASIMLYRFPPEFYRTNPSPCAPLGSGQELSEGDKTALSVKYPNDSWAANNAAERSTALLEALTESTRTSAALRDVLEGQRRVLMRME